MLKSSFGDRSFNIDDETHNWNNIYNNNLFLKDFEYEPFTNFSSIVIDEVIDYLVYVNTLQNEASAVLSNIIKTRFIINCLNVNLDSETINKYLNEINSRPINENSPFYHCLLFLPSNNTSLINQLKTTMYMFSLIPLVLPTDTNKGLCNRIRLTIEELKTKWTIPNLFDLIIGAKKQNTENILIVLFSLWLLNIAKKKVETKNENIAANVFSFWKSFDETFTIAGVQLTVENEIFFDISKHWLFLNIWLSLPIVYEDELDNSVISLFLFDSEKLEYIEMLENAIETCKFIATSSLELSTIIDRNLNPDKNNFTNIDLLLLNTMVDYYTTIHATQEESSAMKIIREAFNELPSRQEPTGVGFDASRIISIISNFFGVWNFEENGTWAKNNLELMNLIFNY
jgi:hypothetical protein